MFIYFGYGVKHSLLEQENQSKSETTDCSGIVVTGNDSTRNFQTTQQHKRPQNLFTCFNGMNVPKLSNNQFSNEIEQKNLPANESIGLEITKNQDEENLGNKSRTTVSYQQQRQQNFNDRSNSSKPSPPPIPPRPNFYRQQTTTSSLRSKYSQQIEQKPFTGSLDYLRGVGSESDHNLSQQSDGDASRSDATKFNWETFE